MNNSLIYRQDAIDSLRMDVDIIPFAKAREYVRAAIETIYNRLEELPPAQPKSHKEKLKEIADALSEKFAYMNTCLNERDIILRYLGVKCPSEIHCNTDCTNIKCESHYCYKKTPSAQSEIIHCKDCIWHNKDINQCNRQVCAVMYADDFCSYGERRGERDGKIN